MPSRSTCCAVSAPRRPTRSGNGCSARSSAPSPASPRRSEIRVEKRSVRDLVQAAGLDVVDEAADGVLLRDERALADARDRLAHVALEVVEAVGVPLRLGARV